MQLPTFLGIGVQRSGTTWLHNLLAAHPNIYVPQKRKEIHYFTLNLERGLDWYNQFFPIQEHDYSAVGEISPTYFYMTDLEPIKKISSITKFVLILRHPVDRAYSQYRLHVRDRNYKQNFEHFAATYSPALDSGYYTDRLKRYFDTFGRENVLVLIYEEIFRNVEAATHRIARFLNVSADGFAQLNKQERINQGTIPRFSAAYAVAIHLAKKLRANNFDNVVNLGKKIGMRSWFGKRTTLPPMAATLREELSLQFVQDIANLEELLGRKIGSWHSEKDSMILGNADFPQIPISLISPSTNPPDLRGQPSQIDILR